MFLLSSDQLLQHILRVFLEPQAQLIPLQHLDKLRQSKHETSHTFHPADIPFPVPSPMRNVGGLNLCRYSVGKNWI